MFDLEDKDHYLVITQDGRYEAAVFSPAKDTLMLKLRYLSDDYINGSISQQEAGAKAQSILASYATVHRNTQRHL